MSKEEILKAIHVCAKKLGRNPSLRELRNMAGVNEQALYRKVGSFKKALGEAGLKARGPGFCADRSELLLDWAAVVRKLGKFPSVGGYRQGGIFSVDVVRRRFGNWKKIGEAFRTFAVEARIEKEWRDVLKIVAKDQQQQLPPPKKIERWRKTCPLKKDRPVYGPPLVFLPGMAHEPTNEAGVLFAFGVLAPRLGFVVKRWQASFPDCVAVREMAKGQWQDQNVEVEMYSRNFLKHRHDAKKCDVIVCWEHNWPECPEWIEVVELRKVVEEMERSGDRKNAREE